MSYDQRIADLEAENARLTAALEDGGFKCAKCGHQSAYVVKTGQVERLEAQVAALRKALHPFAVSYGSPGADYTDEARLVLHATEPSV